MSGVLPRARRTAWRDSGALRAAHLPSRAGLRRSARRAAKVVPLAVSRPSRSRRRTPSPDSLAAISRRRNSRVAGSRRTLAKDVARVSRRRSTRPALSGAVRARAARLVDRSREANRAKAFLMLILLRLVDG